MAHEPGDVGAPTTEGRRIIGLTGLACAGKSTIAAHLASKGALVIDVDRLGHQALNDSQVVEKLCARFGSEILGKDGKILRKILGEKVFSSEEALAFLEGTVHPAMVVLVRAQIAQAEERVVVIDAALLHYMGLDRLCDTVLLVEADFARRLERARGRGWSEQELELRDTALQRKFTGAAAPSIIHNNGIVSETLSKVDSIWKEICNE